MPATASLKILGDWRKQIGVPLRDALAVSVGIMGRTGEEACRHALILMAQSARAMTAQAKARRPVLTNAAGAKYVETWQQGKTKPARVYKFQFATEDPKWKMGGTWANAQKIGNRGLAKRSWMWGLGRLGAKGTGREMGGVSDVYTINRAGVNGYVKSNRLGYIWPAMPSGWESTVEVRAGNKIMAQARQKLETQWRREMGLPRGSKREPGPDAAALARYFST